MRKKWIAAGLTMPVRAEGYAFKVGRKVVTNTFGAKPSKKSGKERSTDVRTWARGEKPDPTESGKDFAKRLMDQKYGPGNYNTGPNSEFSKLKKHGDRH